MRPAKTAEIRNRDKGDKLSVAQADTVLTLQKVQRMVQIYLLVSIKPRAYRVVGRWITASNPLA